MEMRGTYPCLSPQLFSAIIIIDCEPAQVAWANIFTRHSILPLSRNGLPYGVVRPYVPTVPRVLSSAARQKISPSSTHARERVREKRV